MLSLTQIIARHYPFYKGRGRLALSRFQRKPSDLLVATKLNSGHRIYVYPNDYIGRMVLFFGDLDPCLTNFVRRNISKGDVVVDVGANLGVLTLPAAAVVGISGKVIAIEPNSFVVSALERSIKANGLLNIEVINKAVSDFSGNATLTIPYQSFGQAAISASDSKGEACEVMRMDELLPRRNVHLLKIDVEGHEYRVLKGGKRFIESCNVDLVLFESHHARGAFSEREEIVFLKDINYSIFELRKGMFMSPILVDTTNVGYCQRSFDFVAVRPGASCNV